MYGQDISIYADLEFHFYIVEMFIYMELVPFNLNGYRSHLFIIHSKYCIVKIHFTARFMLS